MRPASPIASKPGARWTVTRPPRFTRCANPSDTVDIALPRADPLDIDSPVTNVAEPWSWAAALWALSTTRPTRAAAQILSILNIFFISTSCRTGLAPGGVHKTCRPRQPFIGQFREVARQLYRIGDNSRFRTRSPPCITRRVNIGDADV